MVVLVAGPRWVNGASWFDISRESIDGGGSGWVEFSQSSISGCLSGGSSDPASTLAPAPIATTDTTCPIGIGPGGIRSGKYAATSLTREQQQWLFQLFGNQGQAPSAYGGESCTGYYAPLLPSAPAAESDSDGSEGAAVTAGVGDTSYQLLAMCNVSPEAHFLSFQSTPLDLVMPQGGPKGTWFKVLEGIIQVLGYVVDGTTQEKVDEVQYKVWGDTDTEAYYLQVIQLFERTLVSSRTYPITKEYYQALSKTCGRLS